MPAGHTSQRGFSGAVREQCAGRATLAVRPVLHPIHARAVVRRVFSETKSRGASRCRALEVRPPKFNLQGAEVAKDSASVPDSAHRTLGALRVLAVRSSAVR